MVRYVKIVAAKIVPVPNFYDCSIPLTFYEEALTFDKLALAKGDVSLQEYMDDNFTYADVTSMELLPPDYDPRQDQKIPLDTDPGPAQAAKVTTVASRFFWLNQSQNKRHLICKGESKTNGREHNN